MVGCCSHITMVVWFLGYARHDDKVMASLRPSPLTKKIDNCPRVIKKKDK